MARAMVMYNPAARGAPDPDLFRAITHRVELCGFSVDTARSRSPGDLSRIGAKAAADGFDRVVVCGGDGSIREAAAGLAGTDVPLAVVPLGTANILAREMGLSRSPLACARTAGSGMEIRIGLGRLNGSKVFTFCASSGPDSLAVSDIDLKMKRETGAWAYVYAGMHGMLSRPAPRLVVETPDRRKIAGSQVFVLRAARYGAGFIKLSTRINLRSPSMRVMVIRPPLILRLPGLLTRLLRGGLENDPGVEAFDATCVRVLSDDPMPVQVDGDLGGRTPATIRLEPDSLTLVFPEDS